MRGEEKERVLRVEIEIDGWEGGGEEANRILHMRKKNRKIKDY